MKYRHGLMQGLRPIVPMGAALLLTCLASCLFLGSASADESPRTWKDATGKFEVQAILVKELDGQVYLRSTTGRELVVPKTRLSQADLDYLNALAGENPFMPEKSVLSEPAALLAVSTKLAGKESLIPGLVCLEHEGQAYLMAALNVHPSKMHEMTPNDVPESFVALWDQGEDRRKVDLELVFVDATRQKWILRGPAKDLPKPLNRKNEVSIDNGVPVRLLDLEIDPALNSFAQVFTPAKVSAVFRTIDNSIERFEVETKVPYMGQWTVVINGHGNQVGVRAPQLRTPGEATSNANIWSVQLVDYWVKPMCTKVNIFPFEGDEEKIVWDVVVEYSDPLTKMTNPVLLHQTNTFNLRTFNPNTPAKPPAAPGEPFDPTASHIELKPGHLRPDIVAYLHHMRSKPIGTFLVGRFEEKNPGPRDDGYKFHCQLGYEEAGTKKRVWLDKRDVTFKPSDVTRIQVNPGVNLDTPGIPDSGDNPLRAMQTKTLRLPDIPGFDGKPLNTLRATKTPTGYQITSKQTKFTPPIKANPPRNPPQPHATVWNLLGRSSKQDKCQGVRLNVVPPQMQDDDAHPVLMTLSFDSRWFYFVDDENILYRLNADTLELTASLKFGSRPNAMAYSRHGLLISLPQNGIFWQLDATTLEVEREYSAQNAMQFACAPASDLCFVSYRTNQPRAVSLGIFDLAQGTLLHLIPGQLANGGDFETPIGAPLGVYSSSKIRLSSDGKYLFMPLQRFRVEGTDLIFEERYTKPSSFYGSNFNMSDDGRIITLSRNRPDAAPKSLGLYEGLDLNDAPREMLDVWHTNAIAIGPGAKSLYLAEGGKTPTDKDKLGIYSIDGQQKLKVLMDDSRVRQLLVSSNGYRIFAAGTKAFVIYDIQAGELDQPATIPEKK